MRVLLDVCVSLVFVEVMCVYLCICQGVCMLCVRVRMCVRVRVHLCACVSVRIHAHMSRFFFERVHFVPMCTHVCTKNCTYVYIHMFVFVTISAVCI